MINFDLFTEANNAKKDDEGVLKITDYESQVIALLTQIEINTRK